jgi:hypothetical protein
MKTRKTCPEPGTRAGHIAPSDATAFPLTPSGGCEEDGGVVRGESGDGQGVKHLVEAAP